MIALTAALLSQEVFAAPKKLKYNTTPPPFTLNVRVIRAVGPGCPDGTASVSMSPDGTAFSVLFDQLVTEVAATTSPLVEETFCNVTIGVAFRGQYRVAIIGSDVRGFVAVPAGGQSTLSVQHTSIFALTSKVTQRMNFTQNFVGPRNENIMLSSRFPNEALWSWCGSQMVSVHPDTPFMTVTLKVISQNQNPVENLLAGIDSLDMGVDGGLRYQIGWVADNKNCPR